MLRAIKLTNLLSFGAETEITFNEGLKLLDALQLFYEDFDIRVQGGYVEIFSKKVILILLFQPHAYPMVLYVIFRY